MSIFRFKHFDIEQNRSAMKVGTDGVLLGAWASIDHNPFSILDIGAGTGLIALMLAQRSNAEIIDAIEIDELAYEECVTNYENSNWGDRLFCYHTSLEEFVNEIDDKYDLIVSNPPFYDSNYKTKSKARDLARFEDAMPFKHLVKSVVRLLSNKGIFCVILPFKEEKSFIKLCNKYQLFPNRILYIKGNPETAIKRVLIELSFYQSKINSSELIIETSRHHYTQEYINLTKDFYLKM